MTTVKEKPISAATEKGSKQHITNKVRSDNDIIPHKNKKINTFNSDLFNQIKSSLNVFQVLEYYVLQINSKGFASCPFHHEKTPSFKINSKNNTFKCFDCRKIPEKLQR